MSNKREARYFNQSAGSSDESNIFSFCHFKKETTSKFIKYVTFLKPKAEKISLGRTARVSFAFFAEYDLALDGFFSA